MSAHRWWKIKIAEDILHLFDTIAIIARHSEDEAQVRERNMNASVRRCVSYGYVNVRKITI
jgi:hypothetical protein